MNFHPGKRTLKSSLGAAILIAVGATAVVPVASANQQTAGIAGRVYDGSGNPAAQAEVTIVDLRSGTSRTVSTNAEGAYAIRSLAVGGPYEIRVNGVKQTTVESIALGATYSLPLQIGSSRVEEVLVMGQAMRMNVAPGPTAQYSLADLDEAVAFDRDIKDVFDIDPRINKDGESINCTGKSPRFNTVTLDGVRFSDSFGLNSNGYGTANGMPFPYDAVEQVAVELAPFDVKYTGFSACNINAVTKRGSNEWEGSFFYEYTDQDFKGDTIGSTKFTYQPYEEKQYGFDIRGPIIEDVLFISAAYEKQESPRFLAQGYNGANNGEDRDWLSEETFNLIRQTALDNFGYDPGNLPGDGVSEAEKQFVRVDWNINEKHSAAVIYNYFEGFQDRASDSDDDEFEFGNHYYVKGDENKTYSLSLNSQWTDAFSTSLFIARQEQNDSQVTVGEKDIGDHQINDADGNTIYLGADDSRQANGLNYTGDYFRLNAEYLVGGHSLSAGYQRESLEVFNIFVQHSRGGEYDYYTDSGYELTAECAAYTPQERLDEGCDLTGIDRFVLGRPSQVYYGSGGGTNDPNDAAAQFTNTMNAVYIQDEFSPRDDINLTLGLRYEWWDVDGAPRYNQAFVDENGFRNDATIDGTDLLMPRLGLTWDASEDWTVRAGFGLYSGGNPNVWLSNSWSNDGISNAQVRWRNFGAEETLLQGSADSVALSGQGRPGYDVPQELVDDVAATTDADASDSFLALVDPNYKTPAEWKYSLGATLQTDSGYTFDFDFLHTRGKNPAYYVDVSQEIIGQTSLGLPVFGYKADGENNFMLTNSSQSPSANVFSVTMRKSFDNGIDLLAGYAYTNAQDISPMTSSVAGSNFDNLALNTLVEPRAATSNYVVPHRLTLRLNYQTRIWGDNMTRISLRGYANEGTPGSYVMGSGDLEGDQPFGRHLLYVPTSIDDPNVVIADTFDYDAFEDWRRSAGVGKGLTKRNDYNADWSYRLDLRIDQEVPLYDDVKGRLYFKIYNLTNLLNSSWGEQNRGQFFSQQVVRSSLDEQGRYVFERFSNRDVNDISESASVWEMRVGFSVRF